MLIIINIMSPDIAGNSMGEVYYGNYNIIPPLGSDGQLGFDGYIEKEEDEEDEESDTDENMFLPVIDEEE